jgi:DNA-binding HxlR family transcriptional regulator
MASPNLSHRFEAESVGRALELVGERWTLLI